MTYQCNNGFEHVHGDLIITCEATGSWSGEGPICQGIYVIKTIHKYLTKYIMKKILNCICICKKSSDIFSDMNECELDQDHCHSNATCHNVVGSFMCTCNDGFEGNGTYCIGKKQTYMYSFASSPTSSGT